MERGASERTDDRAVFHGRLPQVPMSLAGRSLNKEKKTIVSLAAIRRVNATVNRLRGDREEEER